MRARLTALSVFLCGLIPAAHAAEMRSVDVDYQDGRYSLVSEAWFDAGIDEVYHVFSRWDLSPRFSGAVVDARDIEPDTLGRPGFFVLNRGCILFFCKSLVRQGYVEREHNVVLRAFADPDRSDFKFSNETWQFSEEDGGTSVLYSLDMQPDFWVPPAIGPYLIKRKLSSDGGDALDRIEAIAREHAAGIAVPGE